MTKYNYCHKYKFLSMATEENQRLWVTFSESQTRCIFIFMSTNDKQNLIPRSLSTVL